MSETIVGSVGVQLVPSAKGFAEKARANLKGLSADVLLKPSADAFRAQVDELTRARDMTINVNADTAAANAQIDEAARARSSTINVDSDTSKASGGLGKLIGLAGVLGTALVPISAGLLGIGTAAGVAGIAVLEVEKKRQKIDQLRQTAAASTSKKTADAALAQAAAIEASLNTVQTSFLKAQDSVKGSFDRLLGVVGPALFAPLTAGLNLVAQILPQLAPLIFQVAGYFSDLVASLSANVANGGLAGFLGYIQSVLPSVVAFISSFAGALSNIFVGLAPAGQLFLGLLTQLFNLLAAMPAEVIAPLVAGLVGLFGGAEIAGIAATVALFATLYQNSATFRSEIDGIAQTIGSVLQPIVADLVNFWNGSLLPAIKQLAPVVGVIATIWLKVWGNIAKFVLPVILQIATIVLDIVVPAIRNLLKVFLAVVGGIVNGAAKAFGWVPGVGGKLKQAAAAFKQFSDAARASLDDIPASKTITIQIIRAIRTAVIGPQGDTAASLVLGGVKGGGVKAPTVSFSGGGLGGGYNAPKGGGGAGPKPKKPKKPKKTDAQILAEKQQKEAASLLTNIINGTRAGGDKLVSVLDNIRNHITDLPKSVRAPLRAMVDEYTKSLKALATKLSDAKGVLKGLQDQYESIAKSIGDAFTPQNLFGGTLAELGKGLTDALANIAAAGRAQQKLIAAGVSAAFVTSLLASGNTALITEAANNLDLARIYGNQFQFVQDTAKGLGDVQASAQLGDQLVAANQTLVDINKNIKNVGDEAGAAVAYVLEGVAKDGKKKNGTH